MANSINGTISADQTYTVQDFIALRTSDEITYYNYSINQYINGYEMFITNLLYDYEDEINELVVTVELTDIERAKYRYKPYLFAFDVYGSTESKFIIMMTNNIIDPKEFDFKRIKLLKYSDLINILNRLQAVNEDFMNRVKSQVKIDFSNNDGNNIWSD